MIYAMIANRQENKRHKWIVEAKKEWHEAREAYVKSKILEDILEA